MPGASAWLRAMLANRARERCKRCGLVPRNIGLSPSRTLTMRACGCSDRFISWPGFGSLPCYLTGLD